MLVIYYKKQLYLVIKKRKKILPVNVIPNTCTTNPIFIGWQFHFDGLKPDAF